MHRTTLFLFLFLPIGLLAQSVPDSLFVKLYKSTKKEKVELLIEISDLYKYSNLDSSKLYALSALTLSENINYIKGQIEALQHFGHAEQTRGYYTKGAESYTKALVLAEKSGDSSAIASSKFFLGTAHLLLEDFNNATNIYLEILDYYSTRADKESQEYAAKLLNNLGIIYTKQGKLGQAISYCQSSLKISRDNGFQRGIANNFDNLGEIYQLQKEHEKAFQYFKMAASLKEDLDDKTNLGNIRANIAEELLALNKVKEAQSEAEKALVLGLDAKELDDLQDIYAILVKIYEKKEDWQKAFLYQKQFYAIYDSLESQKHSEEFAKLQARYKDRQSKLEKKSLLKQQEEDFAIINRQKIIIAIIILLASFLGYSLWQLHKNIKKRNYTYKVLRAQKEKMELQSEELQANNEELKTQSDYLQSTNTEMEHLNLELNELLELTQVQTQSLRQNKEEIQSQNEELLAQREDLNQKNIKLEETLRKLKDAQMQMVQAEKMASLGQLTAGIAHEINNPVNYITSGIVGLQGVIEDLKEILEKYDRLTEDAYSQQILEIDLLKKSLDYQELLEGLDLLSNNIKIGAERTAHIIKGLQVFSHRDGLEPQPTDLHQNLESTLMLLHNEYKDRIYIEKKHQKIPLIDCFGGKINQIFMNILNNSIHAIENEGTITIETRLLEKSLEFEREEDLVEVVISDTGIGISESNLTKIFEPFFTTKDVGKGTGLGLSISLGIVQLHRGKLTVESKLGEGTRFVILLPVNQPEDFINPEG